MSPGSKGSPCWPGHPIPRYSLRFLPCSPGGWAVTYPPTPLRTLQPSSTQLGVSSTRSEQWPGPHPRGCLQSPPQAHAGQRCVMHHGHSRGLSTPSEVGTGTVGPEGALGRPSTTQHLLQHVWVFLLKSLD